MPGRDDVRDPRRPPLGRWDGVSIVIGIVVGTGIFKLPSMVFGSAADAGLGLLAWVLGGALALTGALCYAELAATYPRTGGDYVYLSRAYGAMIGFLFGWAQLAVLTTGCIAMMAYVFADYAAALLTSPNHRSIDIGTWLALTPKRPRAFLFAASRAVCGVPIGAAVRCRAVPTPAKRD